MLIIEVTSKPIPVCPGCEFAVETEDGRVYCGNHDCIFYLRTTVCRCELRYNTPLRAGEGAE